MLLWRYVCMDEKKVRTTIVLYPWVRKAIKRVTIDTGQQMSDFINEVLIDRLAELGYAPPQNYENLADLVETQRDWLLEQTELDENLLQTIIDGHSADQITQLRLALAFDMTEAEIRALNSKQPHQHN